MFKLVVLCAIFVSVFGSMQSVRVRTQNPVLGCERVSNIEEFPYQVSVRYSLNHICGGAIIDENVILTAAQCVSGRDISSMSILAGTRALRDDYEPGQIYLVDKIVNYPGFNKTTMQDNIAIIKLKTPLKLNTKIQPISLQEQGVEVSSSAVAVVTGWGVNDPSSTENVDVLRKVKVKVATDDLCMGYLGSMYQSKYMICTLTDGKDACMGDSGSPLVFENKVVGIVSWDMSYDLPTQPTIYTKVSAFRDWVEKNKA